MILEVILGIEEVCLKTLLDAIYCILDLSSLFEQANLLQMHNIVYSNLINYMIYKIDKVLNVEGHLV